MKNIILSYIFFLFFSCSSKTHDIAFYESGNIKYDIEYENGKIDGIAMYYDDFGNVINKVSYVNDKFHGEWIDYFSNGKISHIISYEYGRKSGLEVWYYESGEKKSEALYRNGKLISDLIRWNKNGDIIYK